MCIRGLDFLSGHSVESRFGAVIVVFERIVSDDSLNVYGNRTQSRHLCCTSVVFTQMDLTSGCVGWFDCRVLGKHTCIERYTLIVVF